MTHTTDTTYDFSAADIARLRDDENLSWAKLAAALSLGSPGSARRAYSALVRPHTESVLPGRSQGSSGLVPVHLADTTLDAIRDAIVGRTVVVQRQGDKTEDIPVVKVTSLKGGTVNFNDGNKSRSVKAEAIIGTK